MFGKLAATSLNGFFSLLALLPVLAVPLMMGGISNGQFWRMALVLVSTFLFSLAVGIYASASHRTASAAPPPPIWASCFFLRSRFLLLALLTIHHFSPSNAFLRHSVAVAIDLADFCVRLFV